MMSSLIPERNEYDYEEEEEDDANEYNATEEEKEGGEDDEEDEGVSSPSASTSNNNDDEGGGRGGNGIQYFPNGTKISLWLGVGEVDRQRYDGIILGYNLFNLPTNDEGQYNQYIDPDFYSPFQVQLNFNLFNAQHSTIWNLSTPILSYLFSFSSPPFNTSLSGST